MSVLAADGSDRQVHYSTGAVIRDLAWSPDGTRIAFRTTLGLQVLNLATGQASVFTSLAGRNPRWMSDSETILFTSGE